MIFSNCGHPSYKRYFKIFDLFKIGYFSPKSILCWVSKFWNVLEYSNSQDVKLGVLPNHQKWADFKSYLHMTRLRAALDVQMRPQKRPLLRWKSSFQISFMVLIIKSVYDNLRRIVIRSFVWVIFAWFLIWLEAKSTGGMTQI